MVFAASFGFPVLWAFTFSVPVVCSVVFIALGVDDESVAGGFAGCGYCLGFG